MKIELTRRFLQDHRQNPLLDYLKSKLKPRTEILVGSSCCVIKGVTYKYPKKLRQWIARYLFEWKANPIVCYIRKQ